MKEEGGEGYIYLQSGKEKEIRVKAKGATIKDQRKGVWANEYRGVAARIRRGLVHVHTWKSKYALLGKANYKKEDQKRPLPAIIKKHSCRWLGRHAHWFRFCASPSYAEYSTTISGTPSHPLNSSRTPSS